MRFVEVFVFFGVIQIFVKSFKDIKRHYTFERLVNELKRLQLVL